MAQYVFDAESAGGVFAHEGIGAQSQGVHDHAPYVVQPLFAVGVGHGVLLWVVEAAREDDDAYRGVALVDAAGDGQAAGGLALEFHVDQQVVGRLYVAQGCQQGRAVGKGVDHFDAAGDAGVYVAALDVHRAAVHFHLHHLAYQWFVVDHHYTDWGHSNIGD